MSFFENRHLFFVVGLGSFSLVALVAAFVVVKLGWVGRTKVPPRLLSTTTHTAVRSPWSVYGFYNGAVGADKVKVHTAIHTLAFRESRRSTCCTFVSLVGGLVNIALVCRCTSNHL